MAFWLPLATTALGAGVGSIVPGVGTAFGAAAGGAIGGAISGQQKYEEQKRREDQSRAMRAAEQRYSFASGQTKDFTPVEFAGSQANEMQAGMLGGGMTGYSLGAGLGKSAYGDMGKIGGPSFTGDAGSVVPKAPGSLYPGMEEESMWAKLARQKQGSFYA